MFKKLFDELMTAKTVDDVYTTLYRGKNEKGVWGVDLAFQHEKISWDDHERLFNLGEIIIKALNA